MVTVGGGQVQQVRAVLGQQGILWWKRFFENEAKSTKIWMEMNENRCWMRMNVNNGWTCLSKKNLEKKNSIYIPPRVICEIGAKATGGQNHRALFGKVLALLLVDHSAHGAGLGHQLLDLGLVDDAGQVAALGNPGAISEPRANCLKKMWKAIRGKPRKMIFLGWVHIYVSFCSAV